MFEHDERYRYCVFCGVDCHDDEPVHKADCPSVTGVYPVREQDFGPKCFHCGKGAFGGMRCMDCGAELKLGDHYMHRLVEEGDPLLPGAEGAEINEVICVGCKAKEELADA